MINEVAILRIKQSINIGDIQIDILDSSIFDNEIVKYSDGSVAYRYTDKRTRVAITKPQIFKDAKLIWQKAQQQQ
jgi:hypothetical protein